jgi:ABC-type lipoprotein release transport system permease subunit
VLGGIAALMLAVALVAAWVPVHRVTRIDPQHALRQG